MGRKGTLAAAAALALAAGCVKAYKPPAPGEPAALVKVKLAYDHAKALAAIPANGTARNLTVEVTGEEKENAFRLAAKEWPELLAAATPAPLDTIPVTVHPDREVRLAVRLSVAWKTTTLETKWVEEKVPRQVTKMETVYVYNAATKRNEPKQQMKTVTEYDVHKRQVLENVTKSHAAGCTAKIALKPVKDGVYLVDYANLLVTEGCTAQAYQQTGRPEGGFQLTPL